MSNEEGIKEVIELLHELKLELVAEMDYASLELQVEAIIDKMYLLSEDQDRADSRSRWLGSAWRGVRRLAERAGPTVVGASGSLEGVNEVLEGVSVVIIHGHQCAMRLEHLLFDFAFLAGDCGNLLNRRVGVTALVPPFKKLIKAHGI